MKSQWNQRNMEQSEKKRQKVFTDNRHNQGKTGGGPGPNPISQAMENYRFVEGQCFLQSSTWGWYMYSNIARW